MNTAQLAYYGLATQKNFRGIQDEMEAQRERSLMDRAAALQEKNKTDGRGIGAAIGTGLGLVGGAIAAPFTGGASIPIGMSLGSGLGGAIGGAATGGSGAAVAQDLARGASPLMSYMGKQALMDKYYGNMGGGTSSAYDDWGSKGIIDPRTGMYMPGMENRYG